MKTTYALAAAFALLTATSAFAAPQTVADGGDSVQVSTARSHYHVMASEFKEVAGAYQLETGQNVTFSQQNHHFYATVNHEAPAEMFATAPNHFTTANGVQVRFSPADDSVGIANFERLSMSVAMAAGNVVTAGR